MHVAYLVVTLSAGLVSVPVVATTGAMATDGPENPISTYAGGPGPYVATAATKVSQTPVAVAVSGNTVYVADPLHHVVRRGHRSIDPVSGLERIEDQTVWAGTGADIGYDPKDDQFFAKFGGDGGPATKAGLSTPSGLVADGQGNVYIADTTAHRVRRVDATGTITTVAGRGVPCNPQSGFPCGDRGPATLAFLNAPTALAQDGAGNLYIADTGANLVRKVLAGPDGTIGTGSQRTITTVAGGGNNNLFPGSSPDDGTTTLATKATLNAPRGIAVDAGGNIHIADTGNARVRRVDAATGMIATEAGSGANTLDDPRDVTLSVDGSRLYISETFDNRVRKLDLATKTVTPLAGSGAPCASANCGDGGPAVAAQLSGPRGTAVTPTGLYIADTGSAIAGGGNRMRFVKFGTNSGPDTVTTVAGFGPCCQGGDQGPATDAQLSRPGGVAVDSKGNVYVADTANNRVRRVDAESRVITTVVGSDSLLNAACVVAAGDAATPGRVLVPDDVGRATEAQLCRPSGVALDPKDDNILYVADTANNLIRKVDLGSDTITTVAGGGAPGGSNGFGAGAVKADGQPPRSAVLNNPQGVAVDRRGNLYIADSFNNLIRRLAPGADQVIGQPADVDDVLTTVAGSSTASGGNNDGDNGPALQASLIKPSGVAVDGADPPNLYIADSNRYKIKWVDLSKETPTITKVWSPPSGSLAAPSGVAVAPSGVVYFSAGFKVLEILPGPNGKVDAGPGETTKTVAGTIIGSSGDGGEAGQARLSNPRGIAIGGAGPLYIADSGNDRVRKVELAPPQNVPTPPTTTPDCVVTPSAATPGEPTDVAPGTWSITRCMNLPRDGHAAVRLDPPGCHGATQVPALPVGYPCGKVLVVGGGDQRNLMRPAEIYDPTSGAWSLTGSLATPRVNPTATVLGDGKVLVAGGCAVPKGNFTPYTSLCPSNGTSSSSFVSSAELFDPTTGRFSGAGAMLARRWGHTSTLLGDGTVLLAGGLDESYPVATPAAQNAAPSAEIFHPSCPHDQVSDAVLDAIAAGRSCFTATPPMVQVFAFSTATLIDPAVGSCGASCGKVLVAGGTGNSSSGIPPNPGDSRVTQLFDPSKGVWVATGPMSSAHVGHGATQLLDGRVLVAGGSGDTTDVATRAEVYDPSTGAWRQTGAMRTPRPSRNGYEVTATLLTGSECAGGAGPPSWCGKVLVAGGRTEVAGTSAELFDPSADGGKGAFRPTGALIVARPGHTATPLGHGLVLAAGGAPSGTTTTAEVFDASSTAQPPLVSGVTPAKGPTTGATKVVVIGVALGGGDRTTTVAFRDADDPTRALPARSVRVDSASQLSVVTPAHPRVGPVDLVVTTTVDGKAQSSPTFITSAARLADPASEDHLAHRFRYEVSDPPPGTPAPSVEPPGGTTLGGTKVAVFGHDLGATRSVSFGSVVVMPNFVSNEEVAAVSPPGAQGEVAISLDEGGAVAREVGRFSYGAGSWNPTGTMGAARVYSAAIALDGKPCRSASPPAWCGKVLVAGGLRSSPAELRSAELYDPAHGTWEPTGSMVVGRAFHENTATALPDGRVLVVGTPRTAPTTLLAEVYDPTDGIWRPTGRVPKPAAGAAGAAGPPTGSQDQRHEHSATLLLDGRVLVVGGTSDDPSAPHSNEAFSDAWKYSASALLFDAAASPAPGSPLGAQGGWTATGSLHTGRNNHAAALLADGSVLVTGGAGTLNTAINSAERYDPASGRWTPAGEMTVGRFYPTATVLDGPSCHTEAPPAYCGDVLVVGGALSAVNNGLPAEAGNCGEILAAEEPTCVFIYSTAAELFDPVSGTWRLARSTKTARGGHSATLLGDGSVLVAGNASRFTDHAAPTSASSEVYDPQTNSWAYTSALGDRAGGHSAALLDGPACRAPAPGSPPPAYCGSVLAAGGFQAPPRSAVIRPYSPELGALISASAEIYTPAPTVAKVEPGVGVAGTSLVVFGTGFLGATEVRFGTGTGNVAAPAVASATRLSVTSPAHEAGPVEVAVVNAGGTSARRQPNPAARFVYAGAPGALVVSATQGDPGEALVSFDAPDDGTTRGPATQYVVKQSDEPIYTANFDDATSLCPNACGFDEASSSYTFSITGLSAGMHHFALRAVGPTGLLGPVSNDAALRIAGIPDAASPCPPAEGSGPGRLSYPAGYSLVGLPGGTVLPAVKVLYSWFDLGARGAYSLHPTTSPVEAGHGYWAYFACPGAVPMGEGSASAKLPLDAYHASIVGNPSGVSPATVSGHDFAAQWDPALNGGGGGYRISGYREPQTLAVGTGTWVFSYVRTLISIDAKRP